MRSYADSDGDGIGDLEGLRQRLGHIAALGVDAIWLCPIYPSPQRDHGYDVADYTAIEPDYGDLATFDHLVADASALVCGSCSTSCRTTAAISTRGSRPRSRRPGQRRASPVLVPPGPDGGPPNNWPAAFGGSVVDARR